MISRFFSPLAVGFATAAASGVVIAYAATPHSAPPARTWDAQAAAVYLDYRQQWWENWSRASRDHGTVCLSCHTAMPYALARPELRDILHEKEETSPERKLVEDVLTRVRGWSLMQPYYGKFNSTKPGDHETAEGSRGTESVLNALVLATRDARAGTMSPDARQAFANMFALQLTNGDDAGSWPWINFSLRPWESRTAPYFGAALAAVAIGREPGGYANSPEIKANVDRLSSYLKTHVEQPMWDRVRGHDNPVVLNQAMLLWASAGMPNLLSVDEKRTVVSALWDAQRLDGGWGIGSLGHWEEYDGVPIADASDGYATGLIAYALEQTGVEPGEPHLARALAWLADHQDRSTGMWVAKSLNKVRDPESDLGKFMSDAATAYAVLALAAAQPHVATHH